MKSPTAVTQAALSLLTCLSLATSLQASPFFHDTFESYTIPATPDNPGDGNTNSWYFDPSFIANTAAGSSPGGIAPNAQILQVQNVDGFGYTRFGRLFDAQATGVIQLEMKFRVHDFTDSSYYLQMVSTDDPISSYAPGSLSLRFSGNNLGVEYSGTSAGSGDIQTFWNPQGGNLIAGDWYQLTIITDLDQKTFSVRVANLTTTSQSGSIDDLFFMQDSSRLNGLLFRSQSVDSIPTGHQFHWSIDDVMITQIPEPGTYALLGLGLLGLLHRRHQRRA